MLLTACCLTEKSYLSETDKRGTSGDPPVTVPVNQALTPAGVQVLLPGMRPQVLALSPDGKLLATSGKNAVVTIDPARGRVLANIPMPSEKLRADEPVLEQILKPDTEAQASYTGLIFAPDGKRLYLSNVRGDIKVMAVSSEGKVTALHSLALPSTTNSTRKAEVPAGLALSPDGRRLYVAGNLSNRMLELDTANGKTLRTFEVGCLPYEVSLTGDKVYVSCWGGRRRSSVSTATPWPTST